MESNKTTWRKEVALKHKHNACAALLDPLSAAPHMDSFCRGCILQLLVAKINKISDTEVESSPMKPERSQKSNFSEGSSSFKSLSAMGSF